MTLAYMSVPDAYGVVEAGVYRSKALDLHNLPFLSHLRLRTVLYLSPEPLVRSVIDFLGSNGTKFVHLGVEVWKPPASWKPISEELIKDALEIVLDVTTHPILVMCSSGIHKTGTVVGCLRRLQQWNLTPILEEYRRYAKGKAGYAYEQFMELFDEDLVTLPKDLPAWFIDQRQMMEEEEAEFVEQLRQEHLTALPDEGLHGGIVIKAAEVLGTMDAEQSRSVTMVTANNDNLPGYRKYYYSSSSPLTTEDRAYKRKIIGKV